MTLAEKVFEISRVEDDLYNKIHEILGGLPFEGCTEPGYFFPCTDCWVDDYDCSVEIIVNRPITREEADAILELGFAQIYESYGEVGKNWRCNSVGQCSPRQGEQNKQIRANLKACREELDRIKALA